MGFVWGNEDFLVEFWLIWVQRRGKPSQRLLGPGEGSTLVA